MLEIFLVQHSMEAKLNQQIYIFINEKTINATTDFLQEIKPMTYSIKFFIRNFIEYVMRS